MIIAFSGHRPSKLCGGYGETPMKRAVVAAIAATIAEHQPERCISGMALGVDQWAAQVCIDAGVPFDAYVPFPGQETKWPLSSQREYMRLLGKARKVVIVAPKFSMYAFQLRNERMVDAADRLCAVWDGSPGGTCNCYYYALKRNKPIDRIDPTRLAL